MRQRILLIVGLFFTISFQAQRGTISGVLSDNDGIPLPGVSVLVKGTSKGTTTDFDGNYSIECSVGDILVFLFVGMQTKEIKITSSMLGGSMSNALDYTTVEILKSDAYEQALKSINRNKDTIESTDSSKWTYNKINGLFPSERIKDIEIIEDKVKLSYFSPDIYFEVGFNTTFGVQFVKTTNLPELQKSFSQGIPVGGELEFQGGETGNFFSYGPHLNTLEFDGDFYDYDRHGRLVGLGDGNGMPSISYNNSLFEEVSFNSNELFFNVTTNSDFFGFKFLNESSKDIYNIERNSRNNISLKYNRTRPYSRDGWKTLLKYEVEEINQPNINGFQNNLFLNTWATPTTFSNKQGTVLSNNSQRRFSPLFNNPQWLFENNRNSISNQLFVTSIQNKFALTEDIKIGGTVSYKYNSQVQRFGLLNGTAGFQDGFSSNKDIKENLFNTILDFRYYKSESTDEIEAKSIVDFVYADLDFSLEESRGYPSLSFDNPINRLFTSQFVSRNTLRIMNQFRYEWKNIIELKLTNNSYYSSIQNDKWFLPSFFTQLDFIDLFQIYSSIQVFSLSFSASLDVNDLSLYYNNLSHNSLPISPQESLSYTTNNDLFINSSVGLEEIENYELNLKFGLYILGGLSEVTFAYYHSKTKGSVFPIIKDGAFELANVAEIRDSGIEISLDSNIRITNDLYYSLMVSYSYYDTEVLNLLNDNPIIPIAGFNTVSKNLVVGEPAGVIVGSAFQRDSQNNIVIGDDGFPLVNPIPQIIGNPIPDFKIGFSNSFQWKNFQLDFVIDLQKGGDIWNGTQNVLNFLGTSQQSAVERGITNFIFDGVNQQGESNTVSVDFYSPNNSISENRFVRYGFEGVSEEAIVDGSYINVKSIGLTYTLRNSNENKPFVRQWQMTLFGNNIFTWSKFQGNSPYGALFGNTSGQELNFFNLPLLSEVGLTLRLII